MYKCINIYLSIYLSIYIYICQGKCGQLGNVHNPRGVCTIPNSSGDCSQSPKIVNNLAEKMGNVVKDMRIIFLSPHSPVILHIPRRKCIFFKKIHIPHFKLGNVSNIFQNNSHSPLFGESWKPLHCKKQTILFIKEYVFISKFWL